MAEVPLVIANVQRGGPSTGLPTNVSQSDTMQARYGTHGDYNAIAIAPSNVGDTFTETVRAFNLAERFRTPVTLLLDEVIGHSREIITIPEEGEIELYERTRPTCKPEEFVPYEMTPNGVNPIPSYGEGYRYNVTGLTHDIHGFPTNRADEIKPKLDKLRFKIENFKDEIIKLRTEMIDDAEYLFVSYGSVSRTALQATMLAREAGVKVGCIQLCTLWPFPEEQLQDICSKAKKIIVAELNMGQIIHEVRRVLPRDMEIHPLQRYDGEILTPMQLLEKLEEVL